MQRRRVDTLFTLSSEVVEDIRSRIGEDDGRLEHVEDLVHTWIQSVPYLPKNYDRRMVRNFVRDARFNLDATKRKLEGYVLAKHSFPYFYSNRNPEADDVLKAIDCVNIVRLPKLTEDGERICVMSLAKPDPEDFDMEAVLKLGGMLYDLTLTCEAPVTGEIFIFDCTHFTSGHLVKFFGATFRHAITVLRDAYAARVTQLHVINCPVMVEKLITAIRPLLPDKVRKRFIVHKEADSLQKYLQAKVLPSDIGGNLESLRDYMGIWQELMVENSDWFREQEAVKIVGTPPKRIEKFAKDICLEGSFRQLNID